MADVSEIDLKELANLPYGKAEAVLREKGLWDDHANGESPRKYQIKVTAEITATQYIEVEARSAEEAKEKAESAADDLPMTGWERDWVDVTDLEVCKR